MSILEDTPGEITPWVECDMCGDGYCMFHDMHVADCDCPSIEFWVEADLYPYDAIDRDELADFLVDNRFEDFPW